MGPGLIIFLAIIGTAALIYLIVRYNASLDEGKEATPVQANRTPSQNRFYTQVPFFSGLLSRLSFLDNCEKHRLVDFMIYAFYKAALCFATSLDEDDNISEENKQRIVEQYNFARYASLGTYLGEKTGLSTDTLGDVLENRSKIYDEIFFSENPFPFPWTMSNISQALYWFLDNGWVKRSDGTFSDTPNFNFELSMLLQVDTDKVSNYSKTRDSIDGILFDYCEHEIPGFIEYLKKI